MTTLLEKAKAHKCKSHKDYNDDDMALAVAWLAQEITTTQVCAAWGCHAGTVYAYLAQAARYAYQRGLLQNGKAKPSAK